MVGGSVREWQVIANEYRISLRKDENIIKLDYDEYYITLWIY